MKILRRNLSLMLALRYLNPLRTMFSIITLICLAGVALGVMVLIVVLSVMEGLQQEMESRVLAFSPHYVAQEFVNDGQCLISDESCDWNSLVEKLQALKGVEIVYPQVESDGFCQSPAARKPVRFVAIQPHNEGQLSPLLPMLKQGSFDFGEGLDQQCVMSALTANQLGVGVGDTVTLTPLGSIQEVADIYAMIQEPLKTQENKKLMQGIATFFDGAEQREGLELVAKEKFPPLMGEIASIPYAKLRDSEKELCGKFYEMMQAHLTAEGVRGFSAEEKEAWKKAADELASLDRDREDGKAIKSINSMVMPVDLEIVGIYQAPENMPGPDVYLPMEIAQNALGYNKDGCSQIQGICLRIADPNQPGDVEQRMMEQLPAPQVSEDGSYRSSWALMPWTKSFKTWHELIARERVMMSFVLTFIALIASFCIMAVMFTMSMQRRREIAVLQALGATPGKIMGIFAWQGVLIGLVGALGGVLLAVLVLYYRLEIQAAMASVGMDPFPMQAHGIELPAVYDPVTFAWQAGKAFIMVTIASIIPAFLVSRQDPAKALRSN